MRTKRIIGISAASGFISAALFLCLIAWTYTYDVTSPLGSDSPSVIDDRIRESKAATAERLNVDHFFDSSDGGTANQVDHEDAGKHRQITFYAPISTPGAVDTNEGVSYTKTVGGVPELHYIDQSEREVQITSLGRLKLTDVNGAEIKLSNNQWLTALNAAGSGDVNLIRADANDVTVLPDQTETETNEPPVCTKAVANKKYVDDAVAHVAMDEYSSRTVGTIYQAATDGFVLVECQATSGVDMYCTIYVSSTTPPSTGFMSHRTLTTNEGGSFCCPIPRGYYYRVYRSDTDLTVNIRWLPMYK